MATRLLYRRYLLASVSRNSTKILTGILIKWTFGKNCYKVTVLYFAGQTLTTTQTQALEKLGPNAPWHKRLLVKYRRLMGVAIPCIFFQVIWWSCAFKYDFWSLFPDRYFMSITMVFGSIIAGKKLLFNTGHQISKLFTL